MHFAGLVFFLHEVKTSLSHSYWTSDNDYSISASDYIQISWGTMWHTMDEALQSAFIVKRSKSLQDQERSGQSRYKKYKTVLHCTKAHKQLH